MRHDEWKDRLAGRVAIVTGAGSGIGEAVALALGIAGCRLVLVDQQLDAAERVARAVDPAAQRALAVNGDVALSATAARATATALRVFGQLNILVHCAGICPVRPALEATDDDWQRVIAVNLNGSFFMARAAATAMQARGGSIVLLASDRGVFGSRVMPAYAASKGGVIALMHSLALELGGFGITVNAVNPGITDTPMSRASLSPETWQRRAQEDALGRLSEPADIADTILFLVGTAGTFMTGQLVSVRTCAR